MLQSSAFEFGMTFHNPQESLWSCRRERCWERHLLKGWAFSIDQPSLQYCRRKSSSIDFQQLLVASRNMKLHWSFWGSQVPLLTANTELWSWCKNMLCLFLLHWAELEVCTADWGWLGDTGWDARRSKTQERKYCWMDFFWMECLYLTPLFGERSSREYPSWPELTIWSWIYQCDHNCIRNQMLLDSSVPDMGLLGSRYCWSQCPFPEQTAWGT